MLCCAVLCFVLLCCAVLCCAVLCCAVLCCTVLYCTVLYCTVLYCIISYHIISYHIISYHIISYHIIWNYIMIHEIILYEIVWNYTIWNYMKYLYEIIWSYIIWNNEETSCHVTCRLYSLYQILDDPKHKHNDRSLIKISVIFKKNNSYCNVNTPFNIAQRLTYLSFKWSVNIICLYVWFTNAIFTHWWHIIFF